MSDTIVISAIIGGLSSLCSLIILSIIVLIVYLRVTTLNKYTDIINDIT